MPGKIPDKELLRDMRKTAKDLDGPMRKRQYREYGEYSAVTVVNRFGSWAEAMDKAGLKTWEEHRPDREEMLEDLRKVAAETDGILSSSKYDERGKFSRYLFRKHFDSWNEAKKEAGLDLKENQITNEEMLEDLKRVDGMTTGPVTSEMYRDLGEFSYGTVVHRFGSWNAAKRQAGLKVSTVGGGVDSSEILFMLEELHRELGRRPTEKDVDDSDMLPAASTVKKKINRPIAFYDLNEEERLVMMHQLFKNIGEAVHSLDQMREDFNSANKRQFGEDVDRIRACYERWDNFLSGLRSYQNEPQDE